MLMPTGGSTAASAAGSHTTDAVPVEAIANEPASKPVKRAVHFVALPGSIANVAAKPRGPIEDRNWPPDEPMPPANLPAPAGAIWTSRMLVSTPTAVPCTTTLLPSTTGGSAVMSGTTIAVPSTVTVSPGRICGVNDAQQPVAVPASARWKEFTPNSPGARGSGALNVPLARAAAPRVTFAVVGLSGGSV